MISNVQHCPKCVTEFVAGVRACSDCGGPLSSGPLPDPADEEAQPSEADDLAALGDPPDTLYATLPGQQADYVAQALATAGIASLLECDGIQQLNGPGIEHKGPLAVSFPVSVYVPGAQLQPVREIVQSITRAGEIVNPWTVAVDPTDLEALVAGETGLDADDAEDRSSPSDQPLSAPQPEGTTTRLLLLLALGVVLLLLMLRR